MTVTTNQPDQCCEERSNFARETETISTCSKGKSGFIFNSSQLESGLQLKCISTVWKGIHNSSHLNSSSKRAHHLGSITVSHVGSAAILRISYAVHTGYATRWISIDLKGKTVETSHQLFKKVLVDLITHQACTRGQLSSSHLKEVHLHGCYARFGFFWSTVYGLGSRFHTWWPLGMVSLSIGFTLCAMQQETRSLIKFT